MCACINQTMNSIICRSPMALILRNIVARSTAHQSGVVGIGIPIMPVQYLSRRSEVTPVMEDEPGRGTQRMEQFEFITKKNGERELPGLRLLENEGLFLASPASESIRCFGTDNIVGLESREGTKSLEATRGKPSKENWSAGLESKQEVASEKERVRPEKKVVIGVRRNPLNERLKLGIRDQAKILGQTFLSLMGFVSFGLHNAKPSVGLSGPPLTGLLEICPKLVFSYGAGLVQIGQVFGGLDTAQYGLLWKKVPDSNIIGFPLVFIVVTRIFLLGTTAVSQSKVEAVSQPRHSP